MKRVLVLLAVLLVSQVVVAENNTPNATNATNQSGFQFPEINFSEAGEKLDNVTQTGVGPLDQVTNFLKEASPYLLLVVGILLIVLSGFGKLIGIILIILAIIRLLWIFLAPPG